VCVALLTRQKPEHEARATARAFFGLVRISDG
jgi:hypothetical protein